MKNSGRWRIGILASAIALLGSLASLETHAMALGRITVQSTLGEPLRAEIDIPEINAEEAASLKAGVASAETFKAAGFDYSAVVADLEVILQRRDDGRAFLRLTSRRPVTEPFVDLIVLANWSSGRITRDYTMLFDPPILRSGIAVAPAAPMLTRPQAAPEATPPARPVARTPDIAPSPPAARPAPVAKTPAAKAGPAEKAPAGDRQVTVKAGDTAGKIAAQNKPASVSLDQMLVALLASNPDAFIGGNVNLLKSGAVLDIPGEQAASAVPRGEARQTLIAQSADFNTFRRKLAEGAPAAKVATAERQASGKVQAKVEDRAPATAAPDKLTLSKGAVHGKPASAVENKIAQDRQAREASARVAELSKNINDLNKLETTAPAASATGASGAKATVAAVPVPAAAPMLNPPAPAASVGTAAVGATPASAATATAPPPVTASQPASRPSATAAPATVAVAPKKSEVKAPAPPPPEPSLTDTLLDNPFALPLGGVLLALLAGFGFYRYRQGTKAAQVDSSFLESRLQPDSFFGASGGQRIDTNDGNVTGSSLVYSPSQLDAAGDVDPVAEADVYLAYGRDLQAEEILKEALQTNPSRVSIHAKLTEIYAKRHDKKSFETVAIAALNLTHGNGPEWAYITEMGRELDPDNPMYQAGTQQGGQPGRADASAPPSNPPDTVAEDAQAVWPSPAAVPAVDVDLDLDFPQSDKPDMHTTPGALTAQLPGTPGRPQEPSLAKNWAASPTGLDVDLDTATARTASTGSRFVEATAPALTLPSEGLTFTPEPFTAAPRPALTPQKAAAPADNGMLEFDLASLSLDLSGPTTESPTHPLTGTSDDPLETRFLLAEEFRAVGDTDGARSLAEEVLAKSSGPLKVKAQAFLSALS